MFYTFMFIHSYQEKYIYIDVSSLILCTHTNIMPQHEYKHRLSNIHFRQSHLFNLVFISKPELRRNSEKLKCLYCK